MHIGLLKIKDKTIYIDNQNKLISYYYKDGKKQIISNNFVISVLKDLVTCHKKKFLYKKEYEVYLDEQTGYKHFYKDGKENYTKFFYENGYNAILYKENSNKFNIKNFTVNGIKICISITLFLAIFNIANNTLNKPTEITNTKIEYTQNKEITIDSSKFKDYILSSENLTKEDQQLLINEAFFEDLSKTKITEDRVSSIDEKMTNITINVDEQNKPTDNTLGWYNDLFPNIINVADGNDNDTKIHEFIHLIQEYSEYSYIKEACADLISSEYYNVESLEYSEAVSRIQFLMELIGPEPIWNLNFSGNTEEFESKIYEILPEEEAKIFLDLLKDSPANLTIEESKQQNDEIDSYLYKIYNILTNENNELNELQKETGLTFDRYYSNHTYFADSPDNDYSFCFSKIMPLEEVKQKNIVQTSVAQKTYITKEEASKLEIEGKKTFLEYAVLNNNYQILSILEENGEIVDYVFNMNKSEQYSISEAVSLGLIQCKYWYYEYISATNENIGEYPLIITPNPQYDYLTVREINVFEPEYEEGKNNILITYIANEPLIKNQTKIK